MYGVFIIKNGSWSLHQAGYATKSNAEQEASYLRNAIGVAAQVFKKTGP
ncbi:MULTISPECIES: hypothetical protein [Rhizobium]|nr:hypothetical protein [Rhizobium leguminosarum]